jgi:hypothetical protein
LDHINVVVLVVVLVVAIIANQKKIFDYLNRVAEKTLLIVFFLKKTEEKIELKGSYLYLYIYIFFFAMK